MKKTKIEKEQQMVTFMIRLYCKHKHSTRDIPCQECTELIEYACARLANCPFGEQKTSCKRCSIHCYSPQMRKRITQVMRHIAPRIFFLSPFQALRHIL